MQHTHKKRIKSVTLLVTEILKFDMISGDTNSIQTKEVVKVQTNYHI